MKKSTLLATAFVALFCFAFSQDDLSSSPEKDYANYPYWIEMMQDQDANYYETVEAFNKYWENREITKGSGYNPFKRWEWQMRFRINPDGTRLPDGYEREVYYAYKATHQRNNEFLGNWENLGPIDLPDSPDEFWGNGRLNAIAFHPSNADIFYVGAPSGGLWKTDDGGETWVILTDGEPTLGVSSIIIDFVDPDVIYLGSGDRDASDAPGLGVFKSTDGGNSWIQKNTGMGNVTVGRMLQDPDDEDILYAATSGGIFKSENAADSWYNTQTGNMKDIVFKPGNPDILYASGSGKFYKSTDSGESWTRVTAGLPGNAARAVLGVTEANPEYVYFFATTSAAFYGLYRSTDGGESFSLQSNSPNIMGWQCNGGSGGQAWYDLDMAVDPLDEETIYGGGINCWKSSDGGVTWTMSSNQVGSCSAYPVHADLHVLEWNPVDGRLYAGNDGGIWYTTDDGLTWNRITNGLAIGQQYKLGQSKLVSNHTITGYQDNGISTYTDNGWVQSDMYADGMEAEMDNTDSTLSYGCMQYGRMYRIRNDKAQYVIAGQGVNGITESGYWVTPFCQHESDPNTMFIGYNNIWRTNNLWDNSPSWKKISNGLGSGQVYVVEHSPANENIFYFETTSGQMFRSDNILDANPTYTNLSPMLPDAGAATDIEAHPWNPEIVYITQNGKVYKSEDKGLSWEDISGTLPNVSLNDIAFYERSGIEGLYVASNIGVFFKDENMSDWIDFSSGLPAAIRVTEIEIYYEPGNPALDKIRASTYGRGLWSSSPYYYTPIADFYTGDTIIPVGCAVDFIDISSGYPHNWSWTFEGSTPSSSTDPNPTNIVYDTPGIFEVSLTISNPDGSDTKTKTSYIKVEEGLLPIVEFESDPLAFCSPGIVNFYDQSLGCPNGWYWEIEPDTYAFFNDTDENSQNPVVKFYQSEAYTVSLTVTNSSGDNTLTKENYIQSGGFTPYYHESFSGSSMSDLGYSIENPDNYITWQLYEVGGTQPGTTAAGVDFTNYPLIGERDRLITPPFNLEDMESAWLEFQHAYAQKWEDNSDSLIIYISGNCGITWERVFADAEDGSGNFATHERTEEFWPEIASDWCMSGWGASCNSIDISQWAGESDVQVAFETYSYFGNPIMIDNITISQFVGDNEISSLSDEILVYPNPANDLFSVQLPEDHKFTNLELVNLMGQQVISTAVSQKERTILIKPEINWNQGIYFLKLTGKNKTITKKLILN